MSLIVGNRSNGLTPNELVATLRDAKDVIRGDRAVVVEVGDRLVRVTQVVVERGGVVVLRTELTS